MRGAFVFALLMVGCIDASSSGTFTDGPVVTVDACSNGRRDVGEADVDCGGDTCEPCASGHACENDADCLGEACVPTIYQINELTGRCWDDSFSGCALVDVATSINEDMCGSFQVAMCQWAANSGMQAYCFAPVAALMPWDANFLCCDPRFL